MTRAVDEVVIELAHRDARVLLTEDKDFGQLVYAATHASAGVIFIRVPATARKHLADTVLEVVRRRGDRLVRMLHRRAATPSTMPRASASRRYRATSATLPVLAIRASFAKCTA